MSSIIKAGELAVVGYGPVQALPLSGASGHGGILSGDDGTAALLPKSRETGLMAARRDALHMLLETRREAAGILAEAREEAEMLKKAAYEEGYAAGFSAGKEEGRKTGYNEGLAAGWQSGLDKAREIMNMAEEVRQAAHKARENALASLSEDILHLAMDIAEKIVRREIARGDHGLISLLEEILRQNAGMGGKHALVRLPAGEDPKRAAEIASTLNELSPDLQVVVDETLKPGDFLVESEAGIFDGRVATRLSLVESALKAVEQRA